MSVLVIRAWRTDTKPIDYENSFVSSTGRKSGLIAWLFSLMRIDPTTRSLTGTERIEFSSASLAGTETRLIPPEWLKLLRLAQTVASSSIDRAERNLSGIAG
jgi:hypothetical protein